MPTKQDIKDVRKEIKDKAAKVEAINNSKKKTRAMRRCSLKRKRL